MDDTVWLKVFLGSIRYSSLGWAFCPRRCPEIYLGSQRRLRISLLLCKRAYSKPLSQEPQQRPKMSTEKITTMSTYVGLKHADLELTSKVHASWARMAKRYTDCTGESKTWEQATGITYLQNALLACEQLKPYLRPRDQFVHDWMHALASNGCMSIACLLLLEFLDCWQSLHGYIAQWHPHAAFQGYEGVQLV